MWVRWVRLGFDKHTLLRMVVGLGGCLFSEDRWLWPQVSTDRSWGARWYPGASCPLAFGPV